METESMLNIVSALAGICFSVLAMYVVMPKIDNACELPMPPLPSYWLGHAWEFLDVKKLLRTNLEWFRELGEVFQIWIVDRHVLVTANPEDVLEILRNPSLFARPPAQTALFNDLQPDNFQTMSREVHSIQRKRFHEAFNSKTVCGFAKTVSKASEALVSRLRAESNNGEQAVNFTPEVADTTFSILLEAVLGSKMSSEQRAQFARASHALLRELLIEYFTYPLRRLFAFTGIRRHLWRKHRAVLKFAEQIVDARENETLEERNARSYDVLDVIRELDPKNRQRQLSNTTMFGIAGFESSSEAITWAVYEICGKPEVARKIQAEVDSVMGERETMEYDDVKKMQYLEQAWKETLRLHPAAGFLLRVAQKDMTLKGSGTEIYAGLQIGVLIAGAQRNARYIAAPDEFRPERWAPDARKRIPPCAYVPFSCGPESCPGRALADYEGVAILATLFRAFDVSLGCDREQVTGISDWTERARGPAPGSARGDTSWTLPVIFAPRQSKHQ